MMKLYQQLNGPAPKSVLKKATFLSHFYDSSLNFLEEHYDKVTQKNYHSISNIIKPTRNLKKELLHSFNPKNSFNKQCVSDLGDLILSCLHWDQKKRISVEDALKHPFFNPKQPESTPPNQKNKK
jgi:serine/threonine protein kinase